MIECKEIAGLTPKGKLMPQKPEEFQYMGDLYERAFFEMVRETGRLRGRINRLEQKIEQLRASGGTGIE